MPTGVHIRSDERRDATAVSETGSKPDADTSHVRPVTCRPGRDGGRRTGSRCRPRTWALRHARPRWRATTFPSRRRRRTTETGLAFDVLVIPLKQELDRDGDLC